MPLDIVKRAKLKQASDLIADVQIELLKEEEKAKLPEDEQTWRDLYSLRIRLGEYLHYGHVLVRG